MRTVSLSPEALKLVPKTPPAAWCWPWLYSDVRDTVHDAARKAGLPRGVGWHVFRHANAELRERAGEGLRTQQQELGHSRAYQAAMYGSAPVTDPKLLDAALRAVQAGSDE